MNKYKFRLVHCDECGVTSPREPAELARQSGKHCLVCGAELEQGDDQVDETASSDAKPRVRHRR